MKALIFDEPGIPATGMIFRIGHIDRAVAIRNWMRGIADVRVEGGVVFIRFVLRRRIEGELAVFAKVKVARLGFVRRPCVK